MSSKIIKACVDKMIPAGKEMAIVPEVMWNNGQTLKVRFLNGEPEIQKRVQQIAKEWENYTNIKFDFGLDDKAEIRIAFKRINEEGNPDTSSWSLLGTMAVSLTEDGTIPKDEPTMNYGWLESNTPIDEYRRVVLHEFGHALGCIHEHQSPSSGVIPWDKPKVYEYYKRTQGWDPEEVDAQVLGRYSETITNHTDWDATSIMEYPIDNELTIGDFEVGFNRELSQIDKDFISKKYPK